MWLSGHMMVLLFNRSLFQRSMLMAINNRAQNLSDGPERNPGASSSTGFRVSFL